MKFAGALRPPTVGAMLSGPICRRSPSWLRNMAPPTASSSPTSPITTLSSPPSSSPSSSPSPSLSPAAEAASAAICGANKCRSIGVPRRCNFGVLLGVAFLCALFPFDGVHGDDNNNGAALDATAGGGSGNHADAEPPTTTEFNYAARGSKKITDKCDNTWECGFPGSVCDSHRKTCQCSEDLPVSNDYDKCGKVAAFNESCFFNEQCEKFNVQTECRDGRCICRFEMSPIINKDGAFECKGKSENRVPERYVDPAMIMILAGMALMFIIICVVLRLFSRARWRENRTIFNTPNPRLMNVSLLRESKLLHGQERRGSKMSVRMPSRQPSMASLRPHSPNPSLGSRRGSRGSSNASASSSRSNRSNASVPLHQEAHHSGQQHPAKQHVRAQITNVPVIEVEVVDAKA